MLEKIKRIILDSQDFSVDTGVPRQINIESIPGKATICMGVRRCGKSTYMLQLIEQLLDKGVSAENILYINFFDDRLCNLTEDNMDLVLEAYYSLFPDKKNAETVYCFFDEIQVVKGWESFVDRILRTEKCEVYITGSSARMLSKEIASGMRGRSLSWELFPFSFEEYLSYRKISIQKHISTKGRFLIKNTFEEYLQCGGFPEVAGLSSRLRVKIHQEYLHAVLFRDLIERYDISHPKAVFVLAQCLINRTASLYSLNKLYGFLQSQGHKVPKHSVADYLKWFEDSYFFFTVRLFDASLSRSNANPKKIYCIDHAMVTSTASGILVNSGHLLENLIFIAIRRTTESIFYYRTKNSLEVDFIVQMPDHSRKLIQASESLENPITKKREVKALTTAMKEQNLTTATIVTRNDTCTIETEAGVIQVIPAWKFLLEMTAVP
ncbi:MAG: ATP-binding protein [Candidatus Aegiribacteria sp.]|nr:ATP-binding protein [Candidatus Aegiribacteria sp.]